MFAWLKCTAFLSPGDNLMFILMQTEALITCEQIKPIQRCNSLLIVSPKLKSSHLLSIIRLKQFCYQLHKKDLLLLLLFLSSLSECTHTHTEWWHCLDWQRLCLCVQCVFVLIIYPQRAKQKQCDKGFLTDNSDCRPHIVSACRKNHHGFRSFTATGV